MRFDPPLVRATLTHRYKRFLADARLQDGTSTTVHCPNPGSMLTCMEPGAEIWLSHHATRSRKFPFTWELSVLGRTWILVHAARANDVVHEALLHHRIPELSDYASVAREVGFGIHTRFDFCLTRGSQRCYVEVKSATLSLGGGRIGFPDAPTLRGAKHLRTLMDCVAEGHRAVLLFCASRSDARVVKPADNVDPAYGKLLREAAGAGVEVLAYRVLVTSRQIRLSRRTMVDLSEKHANDGT